MDLVADEMEHTPQSMNSMKKTVKIRRDIVAIHGEMVLLENYSALDFTGLVKILQNYDRRTVALLRFPFTQSVLQQSFFATELLSKLVYECEANLQSIFPSRDENNEANPEDEETLSLQRDGIYKSTRATLRTIQDLQKGSSTYIIPYLSCPLFQVILRIVWLLVATISPSQILHIPRLIAMDGMRKCVLHTSLEMNEGFPFGGKEEVAVL